MTTPSPRRIGTSVTTAAALVALATLLHTATVSAQEDVQHQVSITISPIHLVLPVVELTGEYRLADKFGVAAIVGYGQVTVESLDSDEDITFSVFEAGTGARYYLFGTFIHGMQLGVEGVYTQVSTDDAFDDVSAIGNGLSVGGFVGYKIAANIGFTFELQIGAQYLVVDASAESESTGDEASDTDSAAAPLANLNLGWSF